MSSEHGPSPEAERLAQQGEIDSLQRQVEELNLQLVALPDNDEAGQRRINLAVMSLLDRKGRLEGARPTRVRFND